MTKLLLMCDPPRLLDKQLTAALACRGFDVGYLNHAGDCYGALLTYRPDFLIVASGLLPAALDRTMRWMRRADGEVDRPRVFLTGSGPSAELADRWHWPRELCLPRPIEGSSLMPLILATAPPKIPAAAVGGRLRL
jgi:hypothetical protein